MKANSLSSASKADILLQLQKEILSLQGFKPANTATAGTGLKSINDAFPNATFPLAAIHEFVATGMEEAAAASGFISILLSSIMQSGGTAIWVGPARTIFPPALKQFGIQPEHIIFIELQKEKEIMWAVEEALKCSALSAVVGELPELSFTASRRLQLAVEQSQVTGFILRKNPRNLSTTTCIARWCISPMPSALVNDLPGVGFPTWNVSLLKVRNGKPGNWQVKWVDGRLQPLQVSVASTYEQQIKIA